MDAFGLSLPSKLTEAQKKQIQSLLGDVDLHLLYKASVHGYTASAFHQRCDQQGPTLIVAYLNSGDILGGYTSQDYTQARQYVNDEKAFLFTFQGTTPVQFKVITPNGNQARYDDYNNGPCFGNEVYFLYANGAQVHCNAGNVYKFSTYSVNNYANGMYGNNQALSECEVFKVTDGKLHLPNYSAGK